jgi:hypothetical protein
MKKLSVFVISLFTFGCVSVEQIEKEFAEIRQDNELRQSSMTLESVNDCISVSGSGDEMTETYRFSTQDCYAAIDPYYKSVKGDYFIRANKSKESGTTLYQVYAVLFSPGWSYPYSATYLKPLKNAEQELVRVDTNRIHTDVECSYGLCIHEEHYTFPLNSSYLKSLSDNYKNIISNDSQQKMRIFRKAQGDVDFVFNINELVGIYRKVEAFQ